MVEPPNSSDDEVNLDYARRLGAPPRLNFYTMLDLTGEEAGAFNEFRDLYKAEAAYKYKVGDHPDIDNEEQTRELQPKIQSAMRHGTPMCPTPLCLFYSPITRLTNMLIHQQR